MSETVRGACAVVTVALLAVLLSSSRPLPATEPGDCDPSTATSSPAGKDALRGVVISDLDFLDADNVWAAGVTDPTGDPEDFGPTVLARWDGSRWSVFSPSPGTTPSAWPPGTPILEVNGANDIWVARDATVCHWDGSDWQTSTVPIAHDYDAVPGDIEAAGRDDIWMVGRADGHHSNDGIERPFTAHWDGHRWRQLRTPPTEHTSGYTALAVVAPDDIWAIGVADNTTYATGKPTGGYWPIAAHWRGLAWEDVGLPRLPLKSELTDITAVRSNEVWAVGHAGTRALALRWNGTTWADLSPPRQHDGNGKRLTTRLTGIASDGAGGMWATGSVDEAAAADPDDPGNPGNGPTTQLLHWTNGRWQIVEPPVDNLSLSRIALVSGTTIVWTTGTLDRSRPVFLHNGPAGR